MKEAIEAHLRHVEDFTPTDAAALEAFRIAYLGKKGIVTGYFESFKSVPVEEKKEYGRWINVLKQSVEAKIDAFREQWSSAPQRTGEDVTLPGVSFQPGAFHPITLVRNEIVRILERMGFAVAEGSEMEDDWHNFSALNFPPDHPARDMQDTFFLTQNPDWALRTHTSSIQVRAMERQQPPIRIIAPGRVFRNEAISSRSHCVFHQIEGLYIDKNVSFADLKQTLLEFARAFFGEQTEIRLRPSYFPFTEPSAEVDIWWGLENEVDYRMTKGTGWLEIMGCGMVDPAVLEASGIDPEVYSGFAFGMGIERIAMQRFQIPDIRAFYENDSRFLRSFQGAL